MSTLQEIERAVEQLSTDEFRTLLEWLAERDAAAWDAQIERDAAAGKLDTLADQAIADHRRQIARSLP